MRILIACDSFKDALPADGACRAIAKGLRTAHLDAIIIEMPLSDGGEGVLDIARERLLLASVTVTADDPLGRKLSALYGLSADGGTALVEMAQASGLQLLAAQERNPLLTSSFGTGQLLADAKARGARRILLAIGGSATNDAGIGMAAALGWQFLDSKGGAVITGGGLQDIVRIVPPQVLPFESVEVLCDVTNPLFGPAGAAFTYGRQKGGTDESLKALDAGLAHVASLVAGGTALAQVPGAGAAGGLGFGALAFLNAKLRRGIDMVLDMTGFDAAAEASDLVITGEGQIDGQSAQGKLVQGVCKRAGKTPVIALCGKLSATAEQIKAIGLKAAYCINAVEQPLPDMLAATAANLEKAAARIHL